MRREDKIKHAKVEGWVAKHEAAHARYFAFLDGFDHARDAPVDGLMKEFGIDLGTAHAAWLHWLVLAQDDGTPLERARKMGGM